ncbi:MAG TPA: hypothetical protein VGO97_01030 [Solirubrobacterales bacterium]|jgi:zinc transporter ZupT|nr:hypothetical protein [Solirubrobacterales bacterium]
MESAAQAESLAPVTSGGSRTARRLRALAPVILLAAALAIFSVVDSHVFNLIGDNPPPKDQVDVTRVAFEEGRIVAHVTNTQPDPLTVASVAVNDAIVNFTLDGSAKLDRFERRAVQIPYPWIAGQPYDVGITSSSGVETVSHVDVAVESSGVKPSGLLGYGLIGLLVGFLPVLLGLMWLPSLRALSPRAIAGFMALTAGLLTFLMVESIFEALAIQARLPGAFGGVGLIVLGVSASFIGLGAVAQRLKSRDDGGIAGVSGDAAVATSAQAVLGGGALAMAIAIGIGLHNLGEGLAIGSSFALGELAFGSLLIIGFTVHNITEGLGIAVPLAEGERTVHWPRLLGLAAIAGLPAVLGAWIGGFFTSDLLGTFFFAIAAGAAAQVVYEVVSYIRSRGMNWQTPTVAAGFVAGVAIMYATGLIAG